MMNHDGLFLQRRPFSKVGIVKPIVDSIYFFKFYLKGGVALIEETRVTKYKYFN